MGRARRPRGHVKRRRGGSWKPGLLPTVAAVTVQVTALAALVLAVLVLLLRLLKMHKLL
jgi:hypothetical protein